MFNFKHLLLHHVRFWMVGSSFTILIQEIWWYKTTSGGNSCLPITDANMWWAPFRGSDYILRGGKTRNNIPPSPFSRWTASMLCKQSLGLGCWFPIYLSNISWAFTVQEYHSSTALFPDLLPHSVSRSLVPRALGDSSNLTVLLYQSNKLIKLVLNILIRFDQNKYSLVPPALFHARGFCDVVFLDPRKGNSLEKFIWMIH
jgi:hypothetical protein